MSLEGEGPPKTTYTPDLLPQVLFDWLIPFTLTIFDNTALEKTGVQVNFGEGPSVGSDGRGKQRGGEGG